jgi:hypothetical protein
VYKSLHGKHTQLEREQQTACKTAETKQPTQPTGNASHLPLYAQLQGNDPLPSLCLSRSLQSPLQQPLQRQAEPQHVPVPAPLTETPQIQHSNTTCIPLYAQMWDNQIPPWLCLPTPQQVPDTRESLQKKSEPMPQEENTTGLPDALKAGIENLSGLSLDDVHVYYNSSAPATVQALAYTQGTEIHVGPGQEQHLTHEAWHVVQQKQRRVEPILQAKGVAINNDEKLEKEAEVMGIKALQMQGTTPSQHEGEKEAQEVSNRHSVTQQDQPSQVIQRVIQWGTWTQNLWSNQNGRAGSPFTPDEMLNRQQAKAVMLDILLQAAESNSEISQAIHAPGTSYDEAVFNELTESELVKTAKGAINFAAEENTPIFTYQDQINAERQRSHYLLVTEGIHKSQGERLPHITVQIWNGGRRVRTYHVIVGFDLTDKIWTFSAIRNA